MQLVTASEINQGLGHSLFIDATEAALAASRCEAAEHRHQQEMMQAHRMLVEAQEAATVLQAEVCSYCPCAVAVSLTTYVAVLMCMQCVNTVYNWLVIASLLVCLAVFWLQSLDSWQQFCPCSGQAQTTSACQQLCRFLKQHEVCTLAVVSVHVGTLLYTGKDAAS